ncbi:hypothetical protein HKBW3S25_01608, partial [Candidatus Hakubella thermalkaliphila]
WATWCDECREEKPAMQRLYEKMQGSPFQMLTIIYRDDAKRAADYMKMNGYTISCFRTHSSTNIKNQEFFFRLTSSTSAIDQQIAQ